MQRFVVFLEKISRAVDQKLSYRAAFFSFLTLCIVFLTGYFVGTFDQSSHFPFLFKEIDASLFPNDPFFDLRFTHYSYFWKLFVPFYSLGIFYESLFVVHVAITFFTFVMIWRLSMLFFKNPLTALLTCVAFAIPKVGFATFPIFEFSLLNRTFVFPFLLVAIELYLRKKFVSSFLLLGLLYNLHVVSVNFILFFFLVDSIWDNKLASIKKLSVPVFAFVVAALPVLLWKFGNSSLDLSLRPAFLDVLAQSLMHTVFYPLSLSPFVLLATMSGLSGFVLFFLASRIQTLSPFTKQIERFQYAALFIVFTELIVAYALPITALLQLQIIRAGIYVLFFGYFFAIAAAVHGIRREGTRVFIVRIFSLVFSLAAFVPLLVVGLLRWLPKRVGIGISVLVVIISFVGFASYFYVQDLWRPAVHVYPEKTSWYHAQEWAKTQTPKDTVFLTPPQMWWLYTPDWRVFSERSSVVTLSEVLEFAFTPEYTAYWQERFDATAPGARAIFKGDIVDSIAKTKRAFYSLTPDQLISLAHQYNASYVVYEKPFRLPFLVAYENEHFRIYEVQQVPILASHEALTSREKFHTID